MSSIYSAVINQAEEAAGYTEGKGSHKISMVHEGPGQTMGNAGPEGGQLLQHQRKNSKNVHLQRCIHMGGPAKSNSTGPQGLKRVSVTGQEGSVRKSPI